MGSVGGDTCSGVGDSWGSVGWGVEDKEPVQEATNINSDIRLVRRKSFNLFTLKYPVSTACSAVPANAGLPYPGGDEKAGYANTYE